MAAHGARFPVATSRQCPVFVSSCFCMYLCLCVGVCLPLFVRTPGEKTGMVQSDEGGCGEWMKEIGRSTIITASVDNKLGGGGVGP